ncbi:MAG: trypsin-like peptidase domain-containing protein [Colwellia sp.]|nr:trypsin-like peptidase domain-containing protein [Colwellia sp.]
MKKTSIAINTIIISCTLLFASAPTLAAWLSSIEDKTMPSLAPMLEKVTPAVVSISVKGTHKVKQNIPNIFNFFGKPNQHPNQIQQRPCRGLGSGVIIDAKEGYIVTNNHVVDKADEIIITLKDGRQIKAKKIGADADSDIALLQIDISVPQFLSPLAVT